LEDVIQDVQAESSPVTPDSAAQPTSQATTQPAPDGDPNGQVPFHQHPRWQQLMRERAQERQELAQLRAAAQRWQSQPQGQPPPLSPEEQQAIQALRRLQSLDPESAKQQQRIEQLERMLQSVQQYQQTALTTQGRGQLQQMASEAGLPTDAKSLAIIENAVTVFLADNPEAVQRFRNADLSVLKDAFSEFDKTFVSKLRREQQAATAQTKLNMTRTVPPRPTGGTPGPAAMPKAEDVGERAFLRQLSERASQRLAGGGR
jgi:predicted RNase H-like nuclease (RuvC/YqgF family)